MATAKTAPSGIFSNIDLEDLDLNDLIKFLTKIGKRTPILSNLVTTQMGDATLPANAQLMKSNIPDVVSGEDLSSDPAEVARKKAERQAALDEARRNRTSATVADKVRDAAEAGEYGFNPFIDIDPNINQPKIEIFPELTEAEKLPATTAGGVININDLINEPLIMAQDPDAGKSTTLSTPPLNPEDQLPTIYTMAKMGPPPKNLKPAADKWLKDNPGEPGATAMEVFLNEPDKYLKTGTVNIGNIKDRRAALGISTPEGSNINKLSAERKENTFTDFQSSLEGVDMNDPQAILEAFRNSYKKGYKETTAAKQYEETGSLTTSQSANTQINKLIDQFENTEGGFKILKQKEIDKLKPKKKDISDEFVEYYRSEFSPNTAAINVKKSSEFRFFDNKRRTLDDQTPEEFFSEYSLKDLEKGGKFHNEYLQFKAIDDVRIKNVEKLQPILRKIFTKVREGTPNQKKSLVNLNIAHKFEASGIKRGYVSETKLGKGTDPTEIYIDVSEYNQAIQPSIEAEARKLYNKYLEFGNEADYIKLQKIDKDMKVLGIQGEIAPGQKIGQAMPFDEKIRQLADEAIDNKFITQTEYDQLINSAEEIAQSKINFFNTFGIKTTYAKGGLVGISHLTRPLGNF